MRVHSALRLPTICSCLLATVTYLMLVEAASGSSSDGWRWLDGIFPPASAPLLKSSRADAGARRRERWAARSFSSTASPFTTSRVCALQREVLPPHLFEMNGRLSRARHSKTLPHLHSWQESAHDLRSEPHQGRRRHRPNHGRGETLTNQSIQIDSVQARSETIWQSSCNALSPHRPRRQERTLDDRTPRIIVGPVQGVCRRSRQKPSPNLPRLRTAWLSSRGPPPSLKKALACATAEVAAVPGTFIGGSHRLVAGRGRAAAECPQGRGGDQLDWLGFMKDGQGRRCASLPMIARRGPSAHESAGRRPGRPHQVLVDTLLDSAATALMKELRPRTVYQRRGPLAWRPEQLVSQSRTRGVQQR